MAEPFDLTSVLEIKHADDNNKLYIMGIKSSVTALDCLKTVVLDGTEEYIRYYDGEILNEKTLRVHLRFGLQTLLQKPRCLHVNWRQSGSF